MSTDSEQRENEVFTHRMTLVSLFTVSSTTLRYIGHHPEQLKPPVFFSSNHFPTSAPPHLGFGKLENRSHFPHFQQVLLPATALVLVIATHYKPTNPFALSPPHAANGDDRKNRGKRDFSPPPSSSGITTALFSPPPPPPPVTQPAMA